ncbi:MAG TPA: GNAT family N-acetyltransferase [Herpetosiphonaceae bacterium]|nr:GNAT family N-acetyltransferase [Herpetosiphonaceae bacterium]
MDDHYAVRLARADDLAALNGIELAAAGRFAGTEFAFLVDGGTLAAGALAAGQAAGLLWIAAGGDDRPVGFALGQIHGDALHLHELDVHPDHGRRGLGRRLVEALCAYAFGAGFAAVTLSTFRDIPWNAPFYASLGFAPLSEAALTPALRELRAHEARAGLPIERRVCMRRIEDKG